MKDRRVKLLLTRLILVSPLQQVATVLSRIISPRKDARLDAFRPS